MQILPPKSKGFKPLSNGIFNVYLRRFIALAAKSIGLQNVIRANI